MTAIERLLDLAKTENGYLEKSLAAYQAKPSIVYEKELGAGKDNITKYWQDILPGMQGQFWCQVFVFWCFVKCYGLELAKKILYIDRWTQSDSWRKFYTPDWSNNFKANGASVQSSKAQAGDIVYFKNSVRVHHTGIVIDVERYSDGTGKLTTIEGNTSSGSDVVANGGCVRIKSYHMNKNGIDSVAWYGRPQYSLAEKTMEDESIVMPTLEKGKAAKGTPCIYVFQTLMEALGYYAMSIDGSYGGGSKTACERFQSDHGLPTTGICDTATWRELLLHTKIT